MFNPSGATANGHSSTFHHSSSPLQPVLPVGGYEECSWCRRVPASSEERFSFTTFVIALPYLWLCPVCSTLHYLVDLFRAGDVSERDRELVQTHFLEIYRELNSRACARRRAALASDYEPDPEAAEEA